MSLPRRPVGLLILAAAFSACGAATAADCRLTLDAAHPVGRCALPSPQPRLADVPVAAAGAATAPVRLRLVLISASGARAPLAPIGLDPPDRAGTFRVRLRQAAPGGALEFALPAGSPPVTVGPVAWLYREP